MLEDLGAWFILPFQLVKKLLIGLKAMLLSSNCLVAHRKYHDKVSYGDRLCRKCGREHSAF